MAREIVVYQGNGTSTCRNIIRRAEETIHRYEGPFRDIVHAFAETFYLAGDLNIPAFVRTGYRLLEGDRRSDSIGQIERKLEMVEALKGYVADPKDVGYLDDQRSQLIGALNSAMRRIRDTRLRFEDITPVECLPLDIVLGQEYEFRDRQALREGMDSVANHPELGSLVEDVQTLRGTRQGIRTKNLELLFLKLEEVLSRGHNGNGNGRSLPAKQLTLFLTD